MGSSSKVEYVNSTDQLIAANYAKNAKAIGFLWGIFSVCYAIILVVVFVQPQWVGTSSSTTKTPSSSSSYFGLWRSCAVASVVVTSSTGGGDLSSSSSTSTSSSSSEWVCRGRLDDLSSIPNASFRVATVFMGIAMLVALLSVAALVLFLCAPAKQSYYIVAIMHATAALGTLISLLVFPSGFDSPEVHLICGGAPSSSSSWYYYSFGSGCSIRWAYVLAIIGLLDGIVLSILGFVLGSRHLKLASSNQDMFASGSIRKIHSIANSAPSAGGLYHPHQQPRLFYGDSSSSNVNVPPSVTYSYASTTKRSANQLQHPIVFVPPPHHHHSGEEEGHHYRSKASLYRAEYATPKQNFQL